MNCKRVARRRKRRAAHKGARRARDPSLICAGRGGWAGPANWAQMRLGSRGLPEGCNSPKVHGSQSFLIRQSDLLLLLCGLLAPLALSLSRAHPPLPTKLLISREPQRAGCRAVVGPCCPRIKGPLHARSPGPQVIFRPHATFPLMQSYDAVAGCAAVWPLMGRSPSSFPPVRL